MIQIRPGKGAIKIICDNQKQVTALLQVTEMGSKTVKFSLPRRQQTKAGPVNPRGPRGVIRLPTSLTTDEILPELGDVVKSVRRITRRQNGENVPTPVVVLDFPPGTELPSRVVLYHTVYRVKPYIPRPVACNNCQRFGHVAEHCRQDIRCPHCAGPHGHDECQTAVRKCANCGSAHSARFRGCQKYAERLKVTTAMVRQGLTYRDAVNAVRAAPVQKAATAVKTTVATATETTMTTAQQQMEQPQQEGTKKKRRQRGSRTGVTRSLAPVLDKAASTSTPAVNRQTEPLTSTPVPIKKLAAMASSTPEALNYQTEVANLSRQALITKLTVAQLGLNILLPLVARLCEESPKSDWSSELHEHLAALQNLISSDDDD
jgi:hypothetical protein